MTKSKRIKVIIDQKPNGPVILSGKTRDEVAQKFQELKASCEGASLMAGAVGRKADGTFELRIDFIKS
jgi:hypothetical protein